MENNKYIRTMIKPAAENGIRYIEDNSKRGIRNLLDLGEYFAHGKFQKSFFDLAHEMLSNENSFYYDIFENLVKNTNHNTLTTFGINMGYNSFTYGASIIREHEKNHNYNVPWIITLNFKEKKEKDENENLLNNDEIIEFIESGKGLGIYTYVILLESNDILDELTPVIKNNEDCAFVIVIHPNIITEEKVKNISQFPNLCVLVLIDDIESQDLNNISLLRAYKCLYGGCFYYDDKNFTDIKSGKFSNKLHSINTDFVVLIKKHGCNEEIADKIYDYMFKSRFDADTTVFMIDFYGDIRRIDNIISDDPCFLSIDQVGQISITNLENKTKYNIRTSSLEDILRNNARIN